MTSPLIDENALLRRIESLERDLRELGPSIAKSFATTVTALEAQQAELEAAQAELDAQQAALTATVADLAATQSDLASTQADLATAQSDLADAQADIVAQQALIVTAQAVSDLANNFSITTSYVDRAEADLVVPTGFTKCIVTATAQAGGLNSTGSPDILYVSLVIDGTPASGTVATTILDAATAAIDTTDSAILTGLTNGQTIPVVARLKSGVGTFSTSTSNRAQVNAFAIFYN